MAIGWYLMSLGVTTFNEEVVDPIPGVPDHERWRLPEGSEPIHWIAAPLIHWLARTSWKERSWIWESIEADLLRPPGNRPSGHLPVSVRLFPVHKLSGGLSGTLSTEDEEVYRKTVEVCVLHLIRKTIFAPWVYRDEEGRNRLAPHLIFIAILDAARRLGLTHIPVVFFGHRPGGIPVVDPVPRECIPDLLGRGLLPRELWDLKWPEPPVWYKEGSKARRPEPSPAASRPLRPRRFPLFREDRKAIPILTSMLRRLMGQEDFSPEGCMGAAKLLQGLYNLPFSTPGLEVWLIASLPRPGEEQLDLVIHLSENSFELNHCEIVPMWENSRMDVAHVALCAEIDGQRAGESPSYLEAWARTARDLIPVAEGCWCWDGSESVRLSLQSTPSDPEAWEPLPRFQGQEVTPLPFEADLLSSALSCMAIRQR